MQLHSSLIFTHLTCSIPVICMYFQGPICMYFQGPICIYFQGPIYFFSSRAEICLDPYQLISAEVTCSRSGSTVFSKQDNSGFNRTRDNLGLDGRKTVCGFANNKGADQPAYRHSLIRAFIIPFLESIIFKHASIEIPIF